MPAVSRVAVRRRIFTKPVELTKRERTFVSALSLCAETDSNKGTTQNFMKWILKAIPAVRILLIMGWAPGDVSICSHWGRLKGSRGYEAGSLTEAAPARRAAVDPRQIEIVFASFLSVLFGLS